MGGSLGDMVVQIFTEFSELQNKFNNSTYDPLDVDNEVVHNKLLLLKEFMYTLCTR